MPSFDIEMSNPIPSGFTKHHGGPGVGGHGGSDWFVAYGMDLGAPAGTDIFAAFDGHVTRFNADPGNPPGSKEFGAQVFVRSANDKMGGYYTHIEDTPVGLKKDAPVTRGQRLGRIKSFTPAHLHFALVEIVGGAPGGTYLGVSSLFWQFVSSANSTTPFVVTFHQNGKQPSV